ncbi:MAG: hypothetical protein EOO88_30265 [Pedobacter sp.]|nr:MAG: hypothetical protein EOO88_30265 [Pedobacter sp.]
MRRKHTTLQQCRMWGASLLVILFVAMSFVQTFHGHAKTFHTAQQSDHDQLAANDKCLVCDFLSHQQGKEFHLPHPVLLVKSISTPVTLNTNVFVGNYKFTLQDFTNKGPPSFS